MRIAVALHAFDVEEGTVLSIALAREDGEVYEAAVEGPAESCQRLDPRLGSMRLDAAPDVVRPRNEVWPEIVAFVGEDPDFWSAEWPEHVWLGVWWLYQHAEVEVEMPPPWLGQHCRSIRQLVVLLATEKAGIALDLYLATARAVSSEVAKAHTVLEKVWARRLAAPFYDEGWRAALLEALVADVDAELNFVARFGRFGTAAVGQAVGVAAGATVAAFTPPGDIMVRTVEAPGWAPVSRVNMEVVADLTAMSNWGVLDQREALVVSTAAEFVERLLRLIEGLFAKAPRSATKEEALAELVEARGVRPVEVELPSGVVVLVCPADLSLNASRVHGAAHLGADDESWYCQLSIEVAGALNPAGARRVMLEAP